MVAGASSESSLLLLDEEVDEDELLREREPIESVSRSESESSACSAAV